MTKAKQLELQRQILRIVQNETIPNLSLHINCCCCGIGCDNEYIGFYASQIAPYIHKKLGYKVKLDIIKHALTPLKKRNFFLKNS